MEVDTLIETLLQKRPVDVSVLCKKYNYFRVPNVQAIKDLYIIHGEPFLMELFNISVNNPSSFDGLKNLFKKRGNSSKEAEAFYPTPDGKPINAEQGKGKKNLWENFKDVFNKGVSIAQGIQGIIGKGNAGNPVAPNNANQPAAEKKILGMNQGLFIGLVAVVVVVVVIVIVKKK